MKLSQALLSSLFITLTGCSKKAVIICQDSDGNKISERNCKEKIPNMKKDSLIIAEDSVQVIQPKEIDFNYCPPCGRG